MFLVNAPSGNRSLFYHNKKLSNETDTLLTYAPFFYSSLFFTSCGRKYFFLKSVNEDIEGYKIVIESITIINKKNTEIIS